ncbi:MAG TPA: non-homologous end-joining DNA ligase [Acidimicrobiia bacterium]|nr:non-homologous end-joining DNA ligase [Acidimicrobiia bacterium]
MQVSNADRVVFPDDGITKGEVVAYYESVAGHMLPFIAGRALTVERYPRGIGAKGFMQKNAPEHFTDEIERHEVAKEDGGTTVYPVVGSAEAIAAFANLGVITFHVPPSTVADVWHPDWVIWDLDPPSGAFDLVRAAATHLREVLGGFGVETQLMTSGSNGYHLRAHLDPVADAETVAKTARGIAALASAAHPDEMTLAFRKADREERVFVDWLRNAPYSTSVVPWSLRARKGAPVAVPLAWEELEQVDPDGVDMSQARQRLDRDPWERDLRLDLGSVAGEVESALAEAGIELEPFDRFRS